MKMVLFLSGFVLGFFTMALVRWVVETSSGPRYVHPDDSGGHTEVFPAKVAEFIDHIDELMSDRSGDA